MDDFPGDTAVTRRAAGRIAEGSREEPGALAPQS
jgi:hypothetical protein